MTSSEGISEKGRVTRPKKKTKQAWVGDARSQGRGLNDN